MRATLLTLAVSVAFAQEITAEKLIEAGHWKRARTLVERRLREAPGDPNAAFLSSQIHSAFGGRTAPVELAAKAVRLDPGVARYHRQLAEVQGLLAQRAGVFQQVLLARRFRKELDTALALDPRDTQALRDLLEFYLLAPGIVGGDLKKAEAVAPRIAAIDSVQGALSEARLAGQRKDFAGMEAALRRAAEARPPDYKARVALARFYLAPEHRDDAAAETWARSSIALDPGRGAAYSVLATLYAARGDWTALESTLSTAAREVPDDLAPYYRAAERLLQDNREGARAERYLRLYLSQEAEGDQPTAALAHQQLGLALRAQGQETGAAREFKLAAQLAGDSARTGGAN